MEIPSHSNDEKHMFLAYLFNKYLVSNKSESI